MAGAAGLGAVAAAAAGLALEAVAAAAAGALMAAGAAAVACFASTAAGVGGPVSFNTSLRAEGKRLLSLGERVERCTQTN